MRQNNVAVIGGGAAGMLAAGLCASLGCSVTLFEKNKALGRKLAITGKGRCNVCNDCTRDVFLENVITNPKFMYPSYSAFSSSAVMDFFLSRGVELKTERGNRVFPVSDKAADIVSCLQSYCADNNVNIIREEVIGLERSECFRLTTRRGEYAFDSVLIATGGVSYPSTGSTGDGYKFARSLGHTIIQPTPSLVPLVCREKYCAELMGLSLKNVTLTVKNESNKTLFKQLGEMLFTHFGISGPLTLSASARLRPMEAGKYRAFIDLKPGLDEAQLDARLLRDFSKNLNKNFSNSLSELLPSKLIPVAVKVSGISPDIKVNSVDRTMRRRFLQTLKEFPLTIEGFHSINEAIVTSGGVDVKQIDPKTMESKICPGLYFAGEVIDCDAYTGGFNLQIAFSTAHSAALGISNSQLRSKK